MIEEERLSQRFRVLKTGKLSFNDNQSVIDCVVIDVSDTGFKVKVVSSVDIPDELLLVDPNTNESAPVKVVWRKAKSLGLQIIED